MSAIIRKIVTVVEETLLEMGRPVTPPTRRAAAIAVIENPFAGKYVEDLSPLIAIGEELGELSDAEIADALEAGAGRARALLAAGLIEGATLRLCGETVLVASRPIKVRASHGVHQDRIESAAYV